MAHSLALSQCNSFSIQNFDFKIVVHYTNICLNIKEYFNNIEIMFPLKNSINPQKLLLSKWTSVTIIEKEKHFIVSKVHWKEGSTTKLEK